MVVGIQCYYFVVDLGLIYWQFCQCFYQDGLVMVLVKFFLGMDGSLVVFDVVQVVIIVEFQFGKLFFVMGCGVGECG